jgi:hypothetical protein
MAGAERQRDQQATNLLRLTPDTWAVSQAFKKIAKLEYCRLVIYDGVEAGRPGPPLRLPRYWVDGW